MKELLFLVILELLLVDLVFPYDSLPTRRSHIDKLQPELSLAGRLVPNET